MRTARALIVGLAAALALVPIAAPARMRTAIPTTRQSFSTYTTAGTNATNYINPVLARAWATVEFQGSTTWAVTGWFFNLDITTTSAPTSGKSITYTLRVNGGDTGLTCTIANTATSCSDRTHGVAIAPGDRLTLKRTTSGSPTVAKSRITIEHQGATANESGYATQSVSSGNEGQTTQLTNAFRSRDDGLSDNNAGVAAAAGNVTALYAAVGAAPGSGKSWTFTVLKNGTAQNGTGGTPDTRVTIADSATTGNSSGYTVAVSAGDDISIQKSTSGSPTATQAHFGVRFAATTNGQSQYCGAFNQSPTLTGNDVFGPLFGGSNAAYVTTPESATEVYGGATSWTMSNLRVVLNASPGTPRSYTYKARKNAADGGPSVTIADAATSGTDGSNTMTVASGDAIDLEIIATNTPSSRVGRFCSIQYMDPATLPDVPNTPAANLSTFPALFLGALEAPWIRTRR